MDQFIKPYLFHIHLFLEKSNHPKTRRLGFAAMLDKEFGDRPAAMDGEGDGSLLSVKLSKKSKKAAEDIADVFGYRIEWLASDRKNNGRVDHTGKVIYIAENAEMPIKTVFGHEMTHAVRTMDGEAYGKLKAAVETILGKEKMQEMVAEKMKLKKKGKPLYTSEEKAVEEVVCDVVGETVESDVRLRELAKAMKGKPSILKYIRDALRKLADIVERGWNDKAKADKIRARADILDTILDAARRDRETGPNEEILNEQGDVVARTDNVGDMDFSHRTYHDFTDEQGDRHQGTRGRIVSFLEHNGMAKSDIKKFTNNMDYWYDLTEKVANFVDKDGNFKYEAFHEWSQTSPLYKTYEGEVVRAVSTLVNNGEYPLNFELSTDCIKREAFTQVLNEMVDLGGAFWKKLTPAKIQELRTLQQSYGMQVACPLCFVEGKRLNIMKWATGVTEKWNTAVRSIVGDNEVTPFGFGDGTFVPDRPYNERTTPQSVREQINEVARIVGSRDGVLPEDLKRMQRNAKAMDDKLQEFYEGYVEKHGSAEGFSLTKGQVKELESLRGKDAGNAVNRMKAIIATHPELQHTLEVSDLVGSKGLMAIRSQSGDAFAKMYSLIVSANGTGTPKIVQDAQPYSGEILEVTDSKFEKAATVGGARLFSFSDYDITKTFDIMQILWDCAARNVKVQSYSKEVPYILMFGTSGVKINMSMLPEARPKAELVEQYKTATKSQKSRALEKIRENAGLEMDGDHIVDMQLSDSHSVSKEFAESIYRNPDYNGNCGAIMVGVSVNHSLYAMSQGYIRQVIPFHLSGMPIAARRATDCQYYRDFTSEQNTGVIINGRRVKLFDSKDKSKVEGVDKDFDFYEGENEAGWDMRQRCRDYVKWCDDNGIVPRFEWAVNSDNYKAWCKKKGYKPNQEIVDMMDARTTDGVFDEYYKVITDFTAYKPVFDGKGNVIGEEAAPHRPVTGNFAMDNKTLGMVFGTDAEGNQVEGRSMLEGRERSLKNAEVNKREIAEKSLLLLSGKAKVEDLVKRDGEEFDNNSDSDLYMERNGHDVDYSVRTRPAPKKTEKVYKLMRLGEDGKLYPLFIDRSEPINMGTWYDADSPGLDMIRKLESGVHLVDAASGKSQSLESFAKEHPEMFKGGKVGVRPSREAVDYATEHGQRWVRIEDTERGQKRFGGESRKYWNIGINGSGAVGDFSMRPGWHAGSLPTMRQIGKGSKKDLRDKNFVWVEGEVSADKDYNGEAQRNPDKDMPDRIPEDGFYMKATNADKAKSQADKVGWYVAGAFKANRIMSDAEARRVIDEYNANHPGAEVLYDYDREGGTPFSEADAQRVNEANGVHAIDYSARSMGMHGKTENSASRPVRIFRHGEALNALNEILQDKNVPEMPKRISTFNEFMNLFKKPVETFLGEVVRVGRGVWNKMIKRQRFGVTGAVLPTIKDADFAIKDIDGNTLYVKRFKNKSGNVLNVAVVNKHGDLKNYISSAHIKSDNNLRNKIKNGAELSISNTREVYGNETQDKSTPYAKVSINSETAKYSGQNFSDNNVNHSSRTPINEQMELEARRIVNREGSVFDKARAIDRLRNTPDYVKRESVFDAARIVSEADEKARLDKEAGLSADIDYTKQKDMDYSARTGHDVDHSARTPVKARDRYEKRVHSQRFQAREALQDSMLGLKTMMESVMKGEGKRRLAIEDIPDFENPYLGENRLSSVNQAQQKRAGKELFLPVLKEMRKLTGQKSRTFGRELEQKTLDDYLFAKHGLERDDVLRKREALERYEKYKKATPNGTKTEADFYNELLNKDYGGLTELMKDNVNVKALQDQIDQLTELRNAEKDPKLKARLTRQMESLEYNIMEARRAVAEDLFLVCAMIKPQLVEVEALLNY